MRNLVFIFLISFSFSQCTEPCDTCGQGKIMENYVLKYFVFADYSNIYIDTPTEDSFGIKFEAKFYSGELITSIFSENKDMLAKFRELARYNGDTTYNRPISTCFPYTCLSNEVGQFNIYCDKEYAGYPAGTLLNEFCTIYFYSAEEFVKKRYVATDINTPVKQYCRPLIEFNAEKYCLFASNNIFFVLSIKPDYPAVYKFIFTYSNNLGEFVANVSKTFD